MDNSKSFDISKQTILEAWRCVKRNAGSQGTDRQSIEDFEVNRKDNLYKIWNRMTSGSYFPPDVRGVEIPKKTGGSRLLGIPTVADRIGQTTAKMVLEPILEPYFHTNSFGYRPRRNAHMAIDVTRRRCWKYDWLLEFDIRGMFDNIPHEYIMKALKHHTQEKWIILYCERWLKVDVLKDDGTRLKRTKGVPQGGCISPLLMNLFMHYSFDVWMERTFKQNPWVRYADDACIHCNSLEEANRIKQALSKRLGEVGLEIHQDKTNIVYCGDSNRRLEYPIRRFTFLGFEFCARPAKSKEQKLFRSFSPAISSKAVSDIRKHIKKNLKIGYRVDLSIEQLARWINPIVRGWFTYYGAFYRSELHRLARYLNDVLAAWCRRKFKNKKGKRQKSYAFLKTLCLQDPKLFVHWEVSRP